MALYKALTPCCTIRGSSRKPRMVQPACQPGCMKVLGMHRGIAGGTMPRGIAEAPVLAALQEPWCWGTWGTGAGTGSGKEQEPPGLLVEITRAV